MAIRVFEKVIVLWVVTVLIEMFNVLLSCFSWSIEMLNKIGLKYLEAIDIKGILKRNCWTIILVRIY